MGISVDVNAFQPHILAANLAHSIGNLFPRSAEKSISQYYIVKLSNNVGRLQILILVTTITKLKRNEKEKEYFSANLNG